MLFLGREGGVSLGWDEFVIGGLDSPKLKTAADVLRDSGGIVTGASHSSPDLGGNEDITFELPGDVYVNLKMSGLGVKESNLGKIRIYKLREDGSTEVAWSARTIVDLLGEHGLARIDPLGDGAVEIGKGYGLQLPGHGVERALVVKRGVFEVKDIHVDVA